MKIRLCHCLILLICIFLICVYTFINLTTTRDLTEAAIVTTRSKVSVLNDTHVVESGTNVGARFTQRRLWIEKKCAASNLQRKHVQLVSGHAPAKLTLCVVPKAACTIWLRLFTFLMNKDSSNKSVTDYSKYVVHYDPGKPYARYNFNGVDKDFISRSVRAMTTRDPYTRLWSAYIDKFFLVDFWTAKGKQIINMVRPKATPLSKRCGNDVTFPEFIQYVIRIGHNMAYWAFDYHWLPVTDICDPCVFKPELIVKQETFLDDFTYVVDRVGLLQDVKPALEVDQDEYEIKTEIDYNFRMFPRYSGCTTKGELAKRLWKVMKLNGYLQPDENMPSQIKDEDLNTSTMVELVRSARKRSGMNKKTKKALRRQALVDAYRQLSDEQLQALQKLYRVDFDLFGYDSSPPS